ncbi:ParB/RepB/Spo0J family partition protein [Sinomonas sp. ASV322]|uniref:ParB/RepB/Spo0J family partition protein n=1 Tax=Sinomonas sp. ASV322 TaxID=3041920 RepID=UPI0027DD5C13|nr:ParB/RepB/Spo0J family partition protein [Sinomonas sp. ASV322]MDQ4502163.1 ParB/RepB/Spo0J family partition protein [Sinomonas sp. ASV322]
MTTFETIELARLEEHPKNPRKDLGDLAELAMSIQAKGIEQALTVVPKPGHRTKYLVLAGHRRRAAAKLAKLRMVPCMIRDDLTTEAAQIEFMLVENVHRRDLTVLEEAEAVQGLFDLGLDEATIAKNIGRSRELVRGRAKIACLGDVAKDKLEKRTLTIEMALDLAEFADDPEATGALLEKTHYNPWAWKHEVEQLRQIRKAQALAPKTKARLEKAGAVVVERLAFAALDKEGLTLSNRWDARDVYRDWTEEQHIAAGHKAIVDSASGGEPVWIVPTPKSEQDDDGEAERPEVAEERVRILAALAPAAKVRREFLREQLLSPGPAVLEWAREKAIEDLARILVRSIWLEFLFGLSAKGTDFDAVKAQLAGLPGETIHILRLVCSRFDMSEAALAGGGNAPSYDLLAAFGSSFPGGGDWAAGYRDFLTGVLGYVFHRAEAEAIAFQAARLAERAADADGAEDDDWCPVCDEEAAEDGSCGCDRVADNDEGVA